MSSYKIIIDSNEKVTLYRTKDDLKLRKVGKIERECMKNVEILLIDDDPLVLNSLTRALSLNGIKVDPFTDPVKALEKFSVVKHSIILSDIMMPGIDGFEILKRAKSISFDCQVILFTGFHTEEVEKRAQELGVDKLFRKPVQIEELTDLINLLKSKLQTV